MNLVTHNKLDFGWLNFIGLRNNLMDSGIKEVVLCEQYFRLYKSYNLTLLRSYHLLQILLLWNTLSGQLKYVLLKTLSD